MEDLISIIVPVYNTAEYLSDCVRSVLEQTHPCFELLLIDDGSTDGSIAFCEKICEADERVRLLKQSHKGVSAARNAGLREAKGDYLFFLDSDDMIHPELLETLCETTKETNSTTAAVNLKCCSETENFLTTGVGETPVDKKKKFICLNRQETLEWFLFCSFAVPYQMGGKMFRREREVLQSVWFDESLTNGEDTKFIYQMIAKGENTVILQNNWYYYRQRGDGASKERSLRAYQNMYEVERYICDQEQKAGREENAVGREKFLTDRIMQWYGKSSEKRNGELKKYLRELAGCEKRLQLFSRLSLRQKIKFYLFFYCYPLFWLLHQRAVLIQKMKQKKEVRNG